MSTPSSTGPGGKVSCRRESTSTCVFNLWYNHASSLAGMRPRIGHSTVVRQKPGSPSRQLEGPRQSLGVHHPNSRAHTKVWESMVKMSKNKCEKGWKWEKVGENPKMPYPPCGRSIKTYARGNNDAPSITKYGSLVRLYAQIVALHPHCALGGGGGVGTRPWWLALLACGSAYWPLAFEPSAMTSRHPYYCRHPHCRRHPPSWVRIQNATSAHGVLP